ncbi:CHASE domain-containing protein [Bdellovibrio sp. ArHS]|uniref:CHASE domain-containing protein n=1 Tax=Bdellovibrio sp. ArHS TaxID=1569284 RepID=UPI0025C279D7|nr:CHASE domain-containing protein [Bdellovibrio sp. ArHS]
MKRLKRVFVLSHEWNVFLVLLIIISVSVLSWWTVKVHLEKEWNARLESEIGKVSSIIHREFSAYSQALFDTRAFVQLHGIPTARQFQEYIESTEILKRSPGLQGIGFAQKLERSEIPDLERKMREQGIADFKFWPNSERSLYTSVVMVEPHDWRNKRALGFDAYSDLTRRSAMDKALLSNGLALSDPVIFVSDESEGEKSQQGVLMYLPVTKVISVTGELEPKKDLLGFAYSVIRIGRFFNGAFGVPQFYAEKVNYKIAVFDRKLGRSLPLYERFPAKDEELLPAVGMTTEREIQVLDKTWTLSFAPLPHFFNWYERYVPILFAFVTLIMLSVIFLALWSTQQFLKFSEKHQDSLALLSKSKSEELALFRRLNSTIADLSSSIEGSDLFEKFCHHLEDVFKIEDCVVFVRESRGPYEKRFQKVIDSFPEFLDLSGEFDNHLKDGVFALTSTSEFSRKVVSFFSSEMQDRLTQDSYFLMRSVLHESGKSNSILIIVKGPQALVDSKVMEYALASIVGQFAMSYDKAILLRRAEDANFMKSSFLANMSHEIRTPLGVIVGYSEILADDELDGEEKKQIVKSVKRNGKELARLIDDILDISKVEAGKLQFEMAQVNLENLIHEVKSIMEVRASDKKIQFNVAKLSNVPAYLFTDDIRLKQILVNVVGNAIKFTENGSVKLLYKTYVNDLQEEFLEFQIQDSGIGISEKNRENLFKPFSQGDVSTTRKYGGTGLGLALSRRLAELLGGELFLLASSVGKGSTFCLRIPLRGVPKEFLNIHSAPVKAVSAGVEMGPVRPIDWTGLDLRNLLKDVRILLVEDSEDNQEIFQHFLKAAGADVVVADDGEKAVESAFKIEPDIVLMDIQIPKMDGKEATKRIRQRGFTKPVIALTAHALNEEVQSCLAAGCNGQITKPVSGELLVQEVYFYLNHTAEV